MRMADEIARRLRKAMTPQEVKLWAHLRALRKRSRPWKFRRQVPLRGYIVDFACFEARLVIEVDGSQHGYAAHRARDKERDETLERNGFDVLRFWNAEIDGEFEGVWRVIVGALQNAELRKRWQDDPPRP
jgi:very-short-patch-repair endonuclease